MGMIGVDKIGEIRRAYFEQDRSIKEIVRTLLISRATVRKVIRGHKTEFKYARGVQPTPKLGDWVEALTEILGTEANLPKRERRSTQRLFEELRGRGYDGAHACILLAIDDDLQSGDPITAERRDMAQLHYKGPFVAERTPLLSLGNRETIVSYAKLPSPKALAIRPYHAKVASATGSTVAEAERNALASCNTDPRWPCFIYAAND